MARFGGVVTAMATPFDEELRVDLDAAVRLGRWLTDHGSEGLVLAGTTGESPTLSDDEKLSLFEAVAAAVTVPVLAGTSTPDTAHSIALTREASRLGVAGILAVTPYYSRPSQAGLLAHFAALAAATDLAVMVYDIPVRTGRRVALETLEALVARAPNVVALKDATGDVAGAARVLGSLAGRIEVYSGDDALTLPLASLGAVGVVGVATHWAGEAFGRLLAAVGAGDLPLARSINRALLPSCSFETSEAAPNPVPTKVALALLGLCSERTRLPMGPVPPGLVDEARRILAGVPERAGALADGSDPAMAHAGSRARPVGA